MDAALQAEKAYLTKQRLVKREISAAEQARTSLLKFTAYTKKDYIINWHHKVLCAYLDAFAEGKIRRLMVFMPPRHGKSELVSRRFPAYMLGRFPDEPIVMASYASSLADSMNLDVQSIMDSEEYKSVFPDAKLLQKGMKFAGRTPVRRSDYFEMANPDHFGSFKSVGVGGGLTGFGFKTGIIDDPIKDRADADSETIRESIFAWYTSTFLTRQNDKYARILATLTRWHEDDPAGRLLELMRKEKDADQWTILSMPGIFEEPTKEFPVNKNDKRKKGEALWPEKYDVDYFRKMKVANSRDYAALIQQRPYTEEGAILKKHYWRYYEPHQLPRYLDEIVLSVDCAFKDFTTSDWVVLQVWGRKGADKYLIDQIKAKLDFNGTCDALLSLVQKYPRATSKYIEDKANGTAVINAMNRRISGLIPVEPEGSKIARTHAVSPQCRSGNVWLPVPETAPFNEPDNNVNDFVDECAKFPTGKHDDQVDACTQALKELENSEGLDIRALTQW